MTYTRDDIVRIARSWIGTPFQHQGRTRRGVDCVGLLVCTAAELGYHDIDRHGYQRRSRSDDFLVAFNRHAVRKKFADKLPGDLVVFYDKIYPCHAGFLTLGPNGYGVVHSVANYRKVVETPYAGEWEAKARALYSFPDVA